MRSIPAHCRAMLTFTLDTTCTVICSSTTIPPAWDLCPDPHQQLPVPLCSALESSILQQRPGDRLHARGCLTWPQPAYTGNQLSRVWSWLMNDVKASAVGLHSLSQSCWRRGGAEEEQARKSPCPAC